MRHTGSISRRLERMRQMNEMSSGITGKQAGIISGMRIPLEVRLPLMEQTWKIPDRKRIKPWVQSTNLAVVPIE